MSTGSQAVEDGCAAHTAVFYQSEREYLDIVQAFVRDGLDKGELAWVAVPAEKVEPLRDALSATAPLTDDVTVVDITRLGRNPGRILGLTGAFLEQHPDRPVRMLGEPVWPGRTAVEYPACLQFEALVNLAFGGLDVKCACLYDAARLDDSILADAHVTHPLVEQGGSQQRSAQYSVDAALHRGNQPLQTSPVALTFTVGAPSDLSGARQHSTRYGRLLGLSPDRIADLQLIVTELATNSLQHGGGTSRLAFWEYDGHLVCEVRDSGHLTDPLVGRRPPAKDRPSPSGLFVVNALADLVRTYTSPDGTTIQAYLRLDRPVDEVA
jgi:anti-sigma regulatory factor (Ser/Thr protein kinase)